MLLAEKKELAGLPFVHGAEGQHKPQGQGEQKRQPKELHGSAQTIRRFRPKLKIACYHRSEDIFALPLQLHEMAPFYQLFFTRTDGVPAWDMDLLARE